MSHQTSVQPAIRAGGLTLLLLSIILTAFNLRPAITAVGPVVDLIRHSLGISDSAAGLLTTLPLLAFAALSPLAPKLANRFGNVPAIAGGLAVLGIGILARSVGATLPLFVGTALIGIGVAICNVLLPSLVKQAFPARVGLMTSVYSTAMGGMAALGSGLSVPLAQGAGLGWPRALLCWGVPCIIALCVWLPQLRRPANVPSGQAELPKEASVWSSPLAWQVALFMGFQSFTFYCSIAWFPNIFQSHHMSEALAGWVVSLLQLVSLPASFATPVLAGRMRDQRVVLLAIGIVYVVGLVGLLLSSALVWIVVWAMLVGIGQGASISLALAMFGLRTRGPRQAAELSGMAQSVGYLLAAVGPVLLGSVFDATHTWTMPLLMILAAAVMMIVFGMGASRDKTV